MVIRKPRRLDAHPAPPEVQGVGKYPLSEFDALPSDALRRRRFPQLRKRGEVVVRFGYGVQVRQSRACVRSQRLEVLKARRRQFSEGMVVQRTAKLFFCSAERLHAGSTDEGPEQLRQYPCACAVAAHKLRPDRRSRRTQRIHRFGGSSADGCKLFGCHRVTSLVDLAFEAVRPVADAHRALKTP